MKRNNVPTVEPIYEVCLNAFSANALDYNQSVIYLRLILYFLMPLFPYLLLRLLLKLFLNLLLGHRHR
jgi:hypothetical protein